MRVPDRQKQRREYLRKKAVVISKGVVVSAVYISTCVAILVSAFVILNGIVTGRWEVFIIGNVLAVLGIRFFGIFSLSLTKVQLQDGTIPYVPPVTSDSLPAEEVLVRGSQEPIQEQSTVLLRAAGESADPSEQLLRASVEEKHAER